jgi:acyl carrier protein
MFGRKLSPDRFRESVAESIMAIVARTCGRQDISEEDDLSHGLHIDDIGRAELLMSVELAFRIEISESEEARMSTVRDIVETVADKTRPDEPAPNAERALLDAIERLADNAARARRTIDLNVAPEILVQHYRAAGFTVEEVALEIETAAIRAGAQVSPDVQRERQRLTAIPQ